MNEQAAPDSRAGSGRDESGRFKPGTSGNPSGRPRSRAGELFDKVVDESRFCAIIEKAATLAEEGSTPMLAAILRLRIPPPRDAGVVKALELEPLETIADAAKALRAIAIAAGRGDVDPDAARSLIAAVNSFLEAIKVADLDQRLSKLEEQVRK